MALPRSNADAAEWWASFLTGTETCPYRQVNSIVCEPHAIYSFGAHYPMARVFRRDDGTVRRVVLTSSYYPSRGFASTPTDQGNVEREVRALNLERYGVKVDYAPLSSHGCGSVPCLPNPHDPEIRNESISVPPYFFRTDPGPEPVKSTEGCLAGTSEMYEIQVERHHGPGFGAAKYPYSETQLPPRPTYLSRDGEQRWVLVGADMHFTEWHEGRWRDYRKHTRVDTTYKQCPHCAAFDKLHEDWYVRMHGRRWGRGRDQGFAQYTKWMERFGSEERWRFERQMDYRATRRNNHEALLWSIRNHVPYGAVSEDADRVKILVDGKYAMRKDERAYKAAQWRDELMRRREARELRRRQRERAQVERFKERMYRKREINGGFIEQASIAARELHNMRGCA